MSNLKSELDEELSRICRKYQKKGLDPEEIADSFGWHEELAISRSDSTERDVLDRVEAD